MTKAGNTYPKRLIEVDLPIKRISAHARREKSIRHGHISTLHIWWARRPLAACRAVILGSLWPDPADNNCPERFRREARERMLLWARDNAAKAGEESFNRLIRIEKNERLLDDPIELRKCLLDFIADFADWDNSNDPFYLETSRALVQAAHEALGGAPGTRPLVVDPFAGGGSIPLEALRVGADAFASDLNPVAVLLNKVVLEYIPKYGQQLADEVRTWGDWVKKEAEKELAKFYPKDPDGATPIAYLWARTIRCEGPACGIDVPLIRSLWLKQGVPSVALRLVPHPKGDGVSIEVRQGAKATEVKEGTVKRGSATCPCCGFTTPATRTRAQFLGRAGGASDARLLAVVSTRAGQTGRFYRSASSLDSAAAEAASVFLAETRHLHEMADRLPREALPYLRSIFNIHLLDVTEWQHLFTPRQLLSLVTLGRQLANAEKALRRTADPGLCDAILTVLAFAIDRQADYGSSLCRWVPAGEFMGNTFGRQALGIIWDFAETAPFGNGSGNFDGAVSWTARVCESVASSRLPSGHVEKASATKHPLPDDSACAFVTDPPYYDAVPYADLADFFYVWLKRAIGHIHPSICTDELTPKQLEVVQLAERNKSYAYKTKQRFETLMTESLGEGRRVTQPSGVGVIVFAHKSTTAWETMLQSVIDAGWIIVASWPIDTEMGARLRAKNSATLSSSVHLVCRPREDPGGVVSTGAIGDWRDVLVELPKRIHEWMPRLASEGVVGADAIFACLGPALEVYSRHTRVEKASGEQVALGEYLEHVWAAVAREALSMIFEGAETTGFEEDARLTAMWLWTLSTGGGNGKASTTEDEHDDADEEKDEASSEKPKVSGFALEYDAARKIAQGLGAHLEELPTLIEVKGETARLLPVAERTRTLFGRHESEAPTTRRKKKTQQMKLGFTEELEQAEETEGWGQKGAPQASQTVLDRVHQSMILFAAGRGEALRRFLVDEGVGRDQRFWRLAQALAALYPSGTDERRWVEGVMARKKGLGL